MVASVFIRTEDQERAAQQCAASVTCKAPVIIVSGHYGVGKTNFSLNLALDAAHVGREVTLIDLDVVNPYFRSSEYRAQLEREGVRVVAPVFAERGSNLDVPSLTGAIAPSIEHAQRVWRERPDNLPLVIIDAGGDDAGVTALARFADIVKAGPYRLLYVVNRYRNLTQTPSECLAILDEIEAKSGLAAHAVVGNSHLMEHTDAQVVSRGVEFTYEVAASAQLPVACIAVPSEIDVFRCGESFSESVLPQIPCDLPACEEPLFYPVQRYVRTPWDAA